MRIIAMGLIVWALLGTCAAAEDEASGRQAEVARLQAERARLVARLAEIDRELAALKATEGEAVRADIEALVRQAKLDRAAEAARRRADIQALEARGRRGERVGPELAVARAALAALDKKALAVPRMTALTVGQVGRLPAAPRPDGLHQLPNLVAREILGPSEAVAEVEVRFIGGRQVVSDGRMQSGGIRWVGPFDAVTEPVVLKGVDTTNWKQPQVLRQEALGCWRVTGVRANVAGGRGHDSHVAILEWLDLSDIAEFKE